MSCTQVSNQRQGADQSLVTSGIIGSEFSGLDARPHFYFTLLKFKGMKLKNSL